MCRTKMKIVPTKGSDYPKVICLNFVPSVMQDYSLENEV
jgi:hypothetical protein